MEDSEIRDKARDYVFYTFGTTRIFERRAHKLKFRRTWITFLGIVTPVIIGGIVLSFGTDSKLLPYFMTAAGFVGLAQLVLSAYSIVARWDETYEYAVNSLIENTSLYNKWKSIRDEETTSLHIKYKELKNAYEDRESKDLSQNITDKEKRFANHEALRYFSQKCHQCKQIPVSSKPTKCDACGNF
ncbi:hypothetical protein G3495_12990 [Shewanella baltica]|uniref:mobilome CxxCx(11)CxxC protein n=1 Tax=Shewanella baltica TaxID=62322 RepID=UPI00217E4731|nr:mobilome CxxCx(11)CxxC protein [Shewanella baltica]MCS6236032.1 hypothetical protein [Shewanella baltica]MCS6271600.1 hypothetical protein [Shewanella baltica]